MEFIRTECSLAYQRVRPSAQAKTLYICINNAYGVFHRCIQTEKNMVPPSTRMFPTRHRPCHLGCQSTPSLSRNQEQHQPLQDSDHAKPGHHQQLCHLILSKTCPWRRNRSLQSSSTLNDYDPGHLIIRKGSMYSKCQGQDGFTYHIIISCRSDTVL